MTSYTAVIPSNRRDDTIQYTMSSLAIQTILPQKVIIVADIEFASDKQLQAYRQKMYEYSQDKLDIIVLNNIEHQVPVGKNNASAMRNAGIQRVESEYVLCVDDDNEFAQDTVEKMMHYVQALKKENQEVVIVPTELYRDTKVVRSQGYKQYFYLLGRASSHTIPTRQETARIAFASSNCIFGSTKLFQTVPLDQQNFPFVYEDRDRTKRLGEKADLYVSSKVQVNHMIEKKTPLEISYIDVTHRAYQKGKNRVLFVKKNAKRREKGLYFSLGLWIHTCALIRKICKYQKDRQNAKEIVFALLKGTWQAMTTPLKNS